MVQTKIGAKIRALRKEKKITLVTLAQDTGFSQSYLSQIERGRSKPSVGALQKISHYFGIPMAVFFETNHEISSNGSTAVVVRSDERKGLLYPASKMRYQLLTPDLKRDIEVLFITADPGGSTGKDKFVHDGEECGVVIRGKMEIVVGSTTYILGKGDSITFRSSEPHSWKNISEEELQAFWAITPPSF